MIGMLPQFEDSQDNSASSSTVQLSLYLVVLAIVVVLFSMSDRDPVRSGYALKSVADGFDIIRLKRHGSTPVPTRDQRSLVHIAREISGLLGLELDTPLPETLAVSKYSFALNPEEIFVPNTTAIRHASDVKLKEIAARLIAIPEQQRPLVRISVGIAPKESHRHAVIAEANRRALALAERLHSYGFDTADMRIGFDTKSVKSMALTLSAKSSMRAAYGR